MAAEYAQQQAPGVGSELEAPRRTTDQVTGDEFGAPAQQPAGGYAGEGFGGVSESEPPHHVLHRDDEPLPKPAAGTYEQELPSSEEPAMVQPTGGEEGYGGAPKSTEGYQEYRDSEPTKFDESPVENVPRSYGTGAEETADGAGYADPSAAFPGAPIDRRVEEPGYGYDEKTSEPGVDSPSSETGVHKKEGMMTKIKGMLPGHKKSADSVEPHGSTVEHDIATEHDTTGEHPKKSLVTKIKEKLPGHHSTTPTAE